MQIPDNLVADLYNIDKSVSDEAVNQIIDLYLDKEYGGLLRKIFRTGKNNLVKELNLSSFLGKFFNENSRGVTNEPKLWIRPTEGFLIIESPDEYDLLMQVYECGNWRYKDGSFPTDVNLWKGTGKNSGYKENTCASMGCLGNSKGFFNIFSLKDYIYKGKDENLIFRPDFFYEGQRIDYKDLREVKKWFKKYKPNRASKG